MRFRRSNIHEQFIMGDIAAEDAGIQTISEMDRTMLNDISISEVAYEVQGSFTICVLRVKGSEGRFFTGASKRNPKDEHDCTGYGLSLARAFTCYMEAMYE